MIRPFHTKQEVLSDGSVLWEVWQREADLRLASSVSRYDAADLADALNDACARWQSRTVENTVDC
jgi:hypothetical protein